MGDSRALTDQSGGGGGGFHGAGEDMEMPKGARPVQGWMMGWMGRLGGKQRRGSLGFNDGYYGGTTPPARADSTEDLSDINIGGVEQGRTMAQLRNESFGSLLSSTPGGDGDQFHFRQRFSRRTNSESQDMKGLVGEEEEGSHTISTLTDLPGGPILQLPTVQEGIILPLPNSLEKESNSMYGQGDPLQGVVRRDLQPLPEQEKGEGGSIFLIDLEEQEDAEGRAHLKPKSKKFSVSSLLGGKFTQNWFFKKEDDELDNLVLEGEEEDEREDVSRKTSTKSDVSRKTSTKSIDSSDFSEDEGGRPSVLRKLKSMAEKSSWREVNLASPQGT